MDTLLDKWQALLVALQTTFSQAPNVLTMDWHALHFLRPQWFYGFIPLALLLLVLLKKFQNSQSWQKVCDAQLLPHILTTQKGKKSYLPVFLIFIAGSLCLTALAGPVIKKLPQPVFREQSALVVLLDLSQSMDAQDIKPSRIERAKLELLDILAKRRGGQSALIVYAADAFTVTPLTDDNATIANLVPSLETSMMPAQGSHLDIALKKAHDLFTQSGLNHGDILLITDGIHQQYKQNIKEIAASGFRVSIFAIGSAQGSPVPLSNGFLKDKNGAIVIPKLDVQKLQTMALSGHGLYVNIDAGEQDTVALTNLFQSSRLNKNAEDKGNNNANSQTDIRADVWQEEGIWLLFPLLFFAALWARKGWLVLVIVLSTLLSNTPPAYADVKNKHTKTEHTKIEQTDSINVLNNLWLTPNQKGMQAFENGDNKKAADEFKRADWKASALYRNGDYEQAAKLFDSDTKQNTDDLSTSDHLYNKGNALAKTGKYKEAIAAYEKAIKLNADNDDAIYNNKLVKDALKKQQEQQKDQNKKDQKKKNQSDKKDDKKNDKNNEKKDQKDGDKSKDKDGKDGKNQKSDKKNSDQQGKQKSDKNKDQQQDKKQDQQQSSDDKKEPENKQKQSSEANKQNEQKKKQQQDEALKQRNPDDQDSKDKQKEQEKLKQDASNSEKEPEHKNDKKNEQQEKDQPSRVQEINPREASVSEDDKAIEQWLRRIKDDPGGLLRRKFLYQYKNIPNQNDSDQPW